MKRGGIKEAAAHTGLSMTELRSGAISGRYPSMRIGGPKGKLWFDFDLLDRAIEQRMMRNLEQVPDRGMIRPVDERAGW